MAAVNRWRGEGETGEGDPCYGNGRFHATAGVTKAMQILKSRQIAPAAALLAAFIAFAAAPAAAQSRYSTWEGTQESGEVGDLVENLRALIDEAERARAADPLFLEDLRDILGAYENPWGVRVLFDDFRDGNYTSNPTWQVSAGQFRIDPRGTNSGLRSAIGRGVDTGSGGLNSLLGAILQPQGQATYASIYTPLQFANAFAVRFELTSRDRFGRLDFGPYQGASGNVAYRLAYFPGAPVGLQLQRLTAKGAVVIGQSAGPVNFEDGKPHVIDWTRDKAGRMVVAVDGEDAISAQDTQIRKPFEGFLMINSGGTYWVRSISIDAAG